MKVYPKINYIELSHKRHVMKNKDIINKKTNYIDNIKEQKDIMDKELKRNSNIYLCTDKLYTLNKNLIRKANSTVLIKK